MNERLVIEDRAEPPFGGDRGEAAPLRDVGPEERKVLSALARKIAATRRPGAVSDIPAGSTYLAQLVLHDLDFPTRGIAELDLGLIYGDGPKHDALCYQVPRRPGEARWLLRIGRTRPTDSSPAWGAARDLPRIACPHLDAQPVEARTEALVPNGFSDSNLLLGQVQSVWALLHNAVALGVVEHVETEVAAFDLAQRITRGIYRDAVIRDVLGTWLSPGIARRYATAQPQRLWSGRLQEPPRDVLRGVGRIGHCLVREIYDLNDPMSVTGLRDVIRHTGSGRPHQMPLTEDWLLDFGRFFAIGASVPQKARAIGPHVARPFGIGPVVATDRPAADSLVLRDLLAGAGGGVRSVRSLIRRVAERDARLLDGSFAQDETRWQKAIRDWLADVDIDAAMAERVAQDPPLVLFHMLEAEADCDGRTLGTLGSILLGETLAAALPDEDDAPDIEAARAAIFGRKVPTCMADIIRFLQHHYAFADGAQLYGGAARPVERPAQPIEKPTQFGGTHMLDTNTTTSAPLPLIEVADYLELGRVVTEWALDPQTRPTSVEDLKTQLDGIAVVPDRVQAVEFVQSDDETLVIRLPAAQMLQQAIDRMMDPMNDGRYPLPQFYADHFRPGFGPVMTPFDTLLSRLGDYTIAQCQ